MARQANLVAAMMLADSWRGGKLMGWRQKVVCSDIFIMAADPAVTGCHGKASRESSSLEVELIDHVIGV